jgi:4-hydroxy 2-oxovalerate aldolase
LSAANGCTPSYAKYFYSKHMLSIDKVELLLSKIEEHKKLSFDKVYAEQLYMDFNKQVFDDEDNLLILKSFLRDKQVVLLAPGKSVLKFKFHFYF